MVFFCGKGDGASVQVDDPMKPLHSHRLNGKGVQNNLTNSFNSSGKSEANTQVSG